MVPLGVMVVCGLKGFLRQILSIFAINLNIETL
jgi:hypothetical protein